MKPVPILTTLGIIASCCFVAGFFYVQSNDKFGVAVISDPCQSNGGIITCSYKQPIRTATTTYCIREHPTASSTLIYVAIDSRTSTGTTNTIQIGKSVTNNNTSTSTLLATKSVLANERWSVVATSSLEASDNLILAPSTATTTKNYIVINGTASYGSTIPTGSCEFIFRIF